MNLNFYTFNIKLINDAIFEVNNSFENASLISIDSLYVAYLLGNYYFGNFHNFNDIDYYKLFIPGMRIKLLLLAAALIFVSNLTYSFDSTRVTFAEAMDALNAEEYETAVDLFTKYLKISSIILVKMIA